MDSSDFKSISEATIRRYSERYQQYLHDIKTLGWGSTEMQEYRFQQAINKLDLSNKSVLDIGCGFGDLFNYLNKNDFPFDKYIGWDINPDLIENTLIKEGNVELDVFDIALKKPEKQVADIGMMFGLLNWKLENEEKNFTYSMQLIKNAFEAVSETLVIDFLSTNYYSGYPVEDFVFYHDPAIMIKKVTEISNNFEIVHNYDPIPQKEFMLFIHK
jgi:SAM-dependent methyltransferase